MRRHGVRGFRQLGNTLLEIGEALIRGTFSAVVQRTSSMPSSSAADSMAASETSERPSGVSSHKGCPFSLKPKYHGKRRSGACSVGVDLCVQVVAPGVLQRFTIPARTASVTDMENTGTEISAVAMSSPAHVPKAKIMSTSPFSRIRSSRAFSVGGTLRRVPVGGIVAAFQKHQPIAARMFGEPVPNGPGVVRLLPDGHIAIGNDPKFGKPPWPLRQGYADSPCTRRLNVGHPPFFCGIGGVFSLNSLGSVAGGRGNGGKEQTAAHQHKEEQTAKSDSWRLCFSQG